MHLRYATHLVIFYLVLGAQSYGEARAEQRSTSAIRQTNQLIAQMRSEHPDIGRIINLIDAGADLRVRDDNGRTLLLLAAKYNNFEAAKVLLDKDKGLDVNQPDNNGNTPLIVAARNGNEELVRLLLAEGAHPGAANNEGVTPLIAAVMGYREKEKQAVPEEQALPIMKLLLAAGAAPDATDKLGYRALHWAISRDFKDITRLLLRAGASVNARGSEIQSPLDIAAMGDDVEMAQLLIKAGASINEPSFGVLHYTPLFTAARNGRAKIVKLLLDEGADPTIPAFGGETPLEVVRQKGYKEIVELLQTAEARTRASRKEL
jgi:uncharacterized protein